MADVEEDSIFISKMPENAKFKFIPNEYERCYDMIIKMKTLPQGVACALCGVPIGECGTDIDDCYYCQEDKIFMHKMCLCAEHRVNKNPAISNFVNKTTQGYHEDKHVNVKFIIEKEAQND